MEKIKEINISELTPDDKNFNKGTEYGGQMLEKSFAKFGAGRSILLDKNNRIIAGNKATEKYGAAGGEKVIVVETDGETLVAVKRTDIDLDTKQGREMALADNATAKADLDWDQDALKDVANGLDINTEEWGIEIEKEIRETERLSELKYEPLYYEPKNIPDIALTDCINVDKYNEKIKALDEYELTDEQKSVLKVFAYRFIKIDFESVANYYAFKASEEEKKAIERLRLVLTDDGIDGFIEDDLINILNLTNNNE